MKKLVLLLVVASLFLASPVLASPGVVVQAFQSGNSLSEYCTNSSELYCLGFVAAIVDAHSTLVGSDLMNPLFCTPKEVTEVTVGQMQKIVVKYLKDHPETLHLTASSLVFKALTEAFPCP